MKRKVWVSEYGSHGAGYVDINTALAKRGSVLLWKGTQQPYMAHWIPLGSGAEFVPLWFIFPKSYIEFFEAL